MIKQAELGMYAIWDEELKPMFSALTQHRRYLAEVIETEPTNQHLELFRNNLTQLDGMIERFHETLKELEEAGRV